MSRGGAGGRILVEVVVLVGSILLAGPLAAQGCPAPSPPADSLAVLEVAHGIIEADNERDLPRILELYAPDAVLMPPGEAPVQGRDAIRPRYEGLFAEWGPEIDSTLSEVSVCGGMAVVSGHNGGRFQALEGEATRDLSDAFVMVLRRRGARWRITRLIWHPDG